MSRALRLWHDPRVVSWLAMLLVWLFLAVVLAVSSRFTGWPDGQERVVLLVLALTAGVVVLLVGGRPSGRLWRIPVPPPKRSSR